VVGPDGLPLGDGIPGPFESLGFSVWMVLWSGPCPGETAFAVRSTEVDGRYEFDGLPAGEYCLIIDPTLEHNVRVLGPGSWSLPAGFGNGPVMLPITLEPAQAVVGLDFAYDPVAPGAR
jgi:hypothetical protein